MYVHSNESMNLDFGRPGSNMTPSQLKGYLARPWMGSADGPSDGLWSAVLEIERVHVQSLPIATCVKSFPEVWSVWQGKYRVHSRIQTRTAPLIALVP